NRLTDSFSGRRIIQEALLMADAIERGGGTSKLTAAELERVGTKAAEAAEKMRALGYDVPTQIQKLADRLKPVPEQLSLTERASAGLVSGFSGLATQIGSVATGFLSAQAIIGAVSSAYHDLVDFVGSSIKAFGDAEAADVRLVAALRQHHLGTQ